MNEKREEPFWAQPPWVMLTDIMKLRRISPWEVEISTLIRSFADKMFLLDMVDFRVSGLALFSASLLHRLKTEELLKHDEEDEEGEGDNTPDDDVELLPPIIPPFRKTSRRISVGELLVALEKVMEEEKKPKRRSLINKSILNEIKPLVFAIDPDRTKIEETIAKVYNKIKQKSKDAKIVKFKDILIDNTRMGIVRTFFCVLLLGFRGYIDVWQDDVFGDIFIELILDKSNVSVGGVNEQSVA